MTKNREQKFEEKYKKTLDDKCNFFRNRKIYFFPLLK